MSHALIDVALIAAAGALSGCLVSVQLPAMMEHICKSYDGPSGRGPVAPPRLPRPLVTRTVAVLSAGLWAIAILPYSRWFLVDGALTGVLGAALAGACIVDLYYRRLPNALLALAAVPAGYVAIRYLTGEWHLFTQISANSLFSHAGLAVLTGALLTALTFAGARFTGHLGMGDAKLTAVLMAWLVPFGDQAMLYTFMIAGIAAIIWGLVARGRGQQFVSLGPLLAGAALFCALATAAAQL